MKLMAAIVVLIVLARRASRNRLIPIHRRSTRFLRS